MPNIKWSNLWNFFFSPPLHTLWLHFFLICKSPLRDHQFLLRISDFVIFHLRSNIPDFLTKSSLSICITWNSLEKRGIINNLQSGTKLSIEWTEILGKCIQLTSLGFAPSLTPHPPPHPLITTLVKYSYRIYTTFHWICSRKGISQTCLVYFSKP